MKKLNLLLITLLITTSATFAQKYGFVDTEYILNNIPSYAASQEKLDNFSEEWQNEVSEAYAAVEKMYKEYQNDEVLLSREAKAQREEQIITREKEARDLQESFFGVEGELYKKREELIQPIQDEIYKAVKEIAVEGGYAVIFDTSSGMNMLYTNPKYDVSDEVLEKLGYKN